MRAIESDGWTWLGGLLAVVEDATSSVGTDDLDSLLEASQEQEVRPGSVRMSCSDVDELPCAGMRPPRGKGIRLLVIANGEG